MAAKTRTVSYLFRFMLLFGINRFWILDVYENVVKGRVGWGDDGTPNYDEDEEVQDIEWDVQDFDNFEDALEISEFLIDKHLMLSDKITIDRGELSKQVGWESSRYDAAVNTLLQVKVDMLDEGKKTDYFFIHF